MHIFHKWERNNKKKITYEKHYFFDGYVNVKLTPMICKCGKEKEYEEVSPFILDYSKLPDWWDY